MISQAKISLNVMPWFKMGAHDRVFNTMLNGGVALTDTSLFYENTFADGENVLFYSLEDLRDYEKSGYDECIAARITDKVKCALADTKHLQEIADSGYECCKGRHSWIERAVVIEKYFR
ncbi:glycosyltransferase [Lachnospira eligens]|nr:glycosyltransferase [Lachnospira eligens]